jgi:hypothetical protein
VTVRNIPTPIAIACLADRAPCFPSRIHLLANEFPSLRTAPFLAADRAAYQLFDRRHSSHCVGRGQEVIRCLSRSGATLIAAAWTEAAPIATTC